MVAKMNKCACYECKKEIQTSEHFTAKDGRILCSKCAVGVAPCSARIKSIVENISSEKSEGRNTNKH